MQQPVTHNLCQSFTARFRSGFPGFTALFLSTALSLLLISCSERQEKPEDDNAKASLELMAYDRDFSAMSQSKGMRAAFLEYLDSNGVLLRPHLFPISGAGAIDYLVQQNDNAYTLTWDPRQAVVAESGELGYTYGVFIMKPSEQDTLFCGTYAHVWKKQQDGKWKLVLNTYNEGVDEYNPDE